MNLEVLSNITYGMYIVTSKLNEELVGCVVNTVTQITSNNPIISISINKDNYTNKIIKESKKVAISILSIETSKDTIVNFGYKSSKDYNKFENSEYEIIADLPIIQDNICGYITGEIINVIDCESHDIFLIRVNELKKEKELPPMTYEYYKTNLKGVSPKNAPTYIRKDYDSSEYDRYECIICGHIYDESIEKIKFDDLPFDWKCPICGVGKDKFKKIN